jgi:hypothetical protein
MSSRDFLLSRPLRRSAFGLFDGSIVLLCLFAGCSGEGYETVPVSGRVTLDGQPLADVGLIFVPLAKDRDNPNVGPGSLGRTDADGRFTLQTINGEKGAVPVEHVVRMSPASNQGVVSSPDDFTPEGNIEAKPAARQLELPPEAADGSLRFKVPRQGTDQADFDLVSR